MMLIVNGKRNLNNSSNAVFFHMICAHCTSNGFSTQCILHIANLQAEFCLLVWNRFVAHCRCIPICMTSEIIFQPLNSETSFRITRIFIFNLTCCLFPKWAFTNANKYWFWLPIKSCSCSKSIFSIIFFPSIFTSLLFVDACTNIQCNHCANLE